MYIVLWCDNCPHRNQISCQSVINILPGLNFIMPFRISLPEKSTHTGVRGLGVPGIRSGHPTWAWPLSVLHGAQCGPRLRVVTQDLGPFFISYLEAQVTGKFSPKSLDRFLSSLQVTWKRKKSQVTSAAQLGISWVALTSLFAFCIFLNWYMWHYMVCFTIYLQKTVRIIFIDKLGIRCHLGSDSIVGIAGCYGVPFNDVTIMLMRDVTIVLTLMHGDVNNASLGKQ